MKKALITVLSLAIVALAVLNLTYRFEPEPDAIYPMTNQHIEWKYAGK